ncbi:IPT/TIG domain-containing protein [Heliobacterium chlorum]|uniref:IPT/TIG domain-containing protein n=1 Tax=Heliobacterium chlorum TaxID=2698 RepID=A0ABR7T140_HELCL|nr:IPT/TIG domain-containing protein [Heliobacterium chlorum]MBC9784502.1 IPT/TIG domain-containing protein [Heliobacterium chlorum]
MLRQHMQKLHKAIATFLLLVMVLTMFPFTMWVGGIQKAEAASFTIQEISYIYDGQSVPMLMIKTDLTSLKGYVIDFIGPNTIPSQTITEATGLVTVPLPSSAINATGKYTVHIYNPSNGNSATATDAISFGAPFTVTKVDKYNIDMSAGSPNPATLNLTGSGFKLASGDYGTLSSYMVVVGNVQVPIDKDGANVTNTQITFSTPAASGLQKSYLVSEFTRTTAENTKVKMTFQQSFGPLNFHIGGGNTEPVIHNTYNIFPYSSTGTDPSWVPKTKDDLKNLLLSIIGTTGATIPSDMLPEGTLDTVNIKDQFGDPGYKVIIVGKNFKTKNVLTSQPIKVQIDGVDCPLVFDDEVLMPLAGLTDSSSDALQAIAVSLPTELGEQWETKAKPKFFGSVTIVNNAGLAYTANSSYSFINEPYDLKIEGDKSAYVDGGDPLTGGNEKIVIIEDANQKLTQDKYVRNTFQNLPNYPVVYFRDQPGKTIYNVDKDADPTLYQKLDFSAEELAADPNIRNKKIKVLVPANNPGYTDIKLVTRYGTGTVKNFLYLPRESSPELFGIFSPEKAYDSSFDPELPGHQDDYATTDQDNLGNVATDTFNGWIRKTPRNVPVKTVLVGRDFHEGCTVYVGETALPASAVVLKDSRRLEVTMPAWQTPGNYRIKVINKDGGTTTKDIKFRYKSLPKITAVNPARVSQFGGNIVQLVGQDYMSEVIAGKLTYPKIRIYYDNDKSAFEEIEQPDDIVDYNYVIQLYSDKDLRFGIPTNPSPFFKNGVSSEAIVEITNPDGQTAEFKDGFEIRDPNLDPQIDSVIPNRVTRDGNIEVLIKGKDFDEDATVYFDMTKLSADKVIRASSTELRVIVPAVKEIYPFKDDSSRVGINIPIRVVNPYDGSSALYTDFQYKNTFSHPGINAVTPPSGDVKGGTLVTITGSDFKANTGYGKPLPSHPADPSDALDPGDRQTTPGEYTKVYFGPFEQPAHRVTSNTIEVFTPPGELGTYDVRVVNPDGAVALLKNAYTYKMVDSAPHILSVTPQIGPIQGGTSVTIKASDVRTNAKVYFGGKEATIIQVVATGETDSTNSEPIKLIYVKTPTNSQGWKRVTLTNPDGGTVSTGPKGYYFIPPGSSPTITSITPKSGPSIGGTTVVIKGTDFRKTIKSYPPDLVDIYTEIYGPLGPDEVKTVLPTVTFGGVPVPPEQVFYQDDQTLEVVTPVNKAGAKDVTVTNWDFGSVTVANGFTYIGASPVIESISPCGADINDLPRPSILIAGTDLYNDGTGLIVRFGESTRQPASGPYDVTKTQLGMSDSGVPIPLPDSKPGVETVTYDSTTKRGVYRVTVPNLEGLYNGIDPYSDTNKIKITIYNPDGQEIQWSGRFRLFDNESGPQILSITPDTASAKGGKAVRIKMTNLLIDWNKKQQWPYFVFGGIRVMPNDATGINYPADPNKDLTNEPVRLITPGNSTTDEWEWEVIVPEYPWPNDDDHKNLTQLPVDVMAVDRLWCTSGTADSKFIYTRPAGGLELLSVTPDKSPVEGNITAVITAAINSNSKGFNNNGGMPRVEFGGVEAGVLSLTPTELTVQVPAHEAGKVDISVTNPDGSEGILAQKFTYTKMPLIESIRPASGPVSGGTEVSITGRGFAQGAKVSFGSGQATVKSVSDTEIKLVTPAGPAIPTGENRIPVDVTVTNTDGSAHTYAKGFTYYKDEGQPTEAPLIVAKAINENTVRVTWSPINMAKAYEVEVSEGGRGNFRLYEVIDKDHLQNGQIYVLVKGLSGDTKYWFRVRAISSLGPGPYSDAVSADTGSNNGWKGFEQPDNEAVTIPGGAKLVIHKGPPEKYYDLRTGTMGSAAKKAIAFSPDAQGFSSPVLLDSGDWKVLIPPLALRYNSNPLTDAYATVFVTPVTGREKEQVLMANRYKRPISPIYEFKLTFDKDSQSSTPAVYAQAVTLTLNYQATVPTQRAAMYYYDGMNRAWTKVDGYTDNVAVSAAITRAGYYAVFPE